MPKPGEFSYYERIGAESRARGLNKPFSDARRGSLLMEAGAILLLLPPPPCRVLECGCGPGWLSYFLSKSGYQVIGQDVNSQVVALARENPMFSSLPNAPEFVIGDYEHLPFENEFDAVVFFDSLHHATDLAAVIASAYRALKPGGRMIASEPGLGHEKSSREVIAEYDVTDKDTPPSLTLRLGLQAGFSEGHVFPHAALLGRSLYRPTARLSRLARLAFHAAFARRNGIVLLVKRAP